MTVDEIDAVRSDGGLVRIRALARSDRDALLALNTRVSDKSLYRRFFNVSRFAADAYVEKLLRAANADYQVLVAVIGDRLVGVASCERVDTTSAEFALLVEDSDQHAGIGTLLMEHLAGAARQNGIRRFVADVLTDNSPMIRLLQQLGAVQTAAPNGQLIVQPMIASGTELIVGAVQDAQFGPLLMLGAGGVLADLIADRQFRLAPLSVEDADEMIAGLRCAPLLDGYRGRIPVSRTALHTLLVRLAVLVEELPEILEIDLNPVVCRGEDLIVVDAKIRVGPTVVIPDPALRQLRH